MNFFKKKQPNEVERGKDEFGRQYVVVKPTLVANTAKCNHYFVPAGKREEDTKLLPYSCKYCGKGVLVRKKSEIKDGKLVG